MILQSLYELYDRLAADPGYEIAPPGFSLQKISFKVVLSKAGDLVDIQDARVLTNNKLRPRPVRVLGSTKPSGSGMNPCFLWDNRAYLLGADPEGEDRARSVQSFHAFRDRHLEAQTEIGSSPFDAVCAFLRNWDPDQAPHFPALSDAAKTGFGLFQIQGETAWVHEDSPIQEWWRRRLGAVEHGPTGTCLVTGEQQPLARLHEKVKGLAGGQSFGSGLVSFDEEAFRSFGKEQSFNAPVSEQAAYRYMAALNGLLDGPRREKHRLTLGDATVVFWTDSATATEDLFARFASEGSTLADSGDAQDEGLRQKLEAFLQALRQGREAYAKLEQEPERKGFHLLGLSPNAGRVAVRFFLSGTLAELLENLRRHHRDIGLDPQPAAGKRRADPEFPPLWLLLRQTAREAKDIPPTLAAPLLRAVVTGARYPEALFAAVLRRIAADRRIDYPRACVLKGYLNRNLNREVTMSLDKDRPDPSYRLGRLFAALEKTQKDALGEKLNKTIRDSYYGTASATPVTVFPRLLRTYQHHLAKLEGGLRVHRERLVQEILSSLDGFPAHFGLADQGLFAIGYYHQTRDFYTKAAPASGNTPNPTFGEPEEEQ